MPKTVFFGELQEGKWDCGAPRKCYKDQLKRQLAQVGISQQSWQQRASDRARKASCEFEAATWSHKEKRRRQKEQAASWSSSTYSSVESAVGVARQKSVSTATNECARIDHQSSQQSSSARNEPSSSSYSASLASFSEVLVLLQYAELTAVSPTFPYQAGMPSNLTPHSHQMSLHTVAEWVIFQTPLSGSYKHLVDSLLCILQSGVAKMLKVHF